MKREKINEVIDLSEIVISEQVGEDFIEIAKGVNIEELTKGDKNPMFVTVEVIHEGVSGNNNYYDRDTIKELHKQILAKKPNAYQGHIDISEIDSKNPEAKTIWIGAGLKEIDGKLALFAKGYVLPEEKKFRGYLTRAVAAGKRMPVSIYGLSKRIYDSARRVYKVTELDLQSIDWAREFAEGVKSLSGAPKLTSEMIDYNLLEIEDMDYSKVTLEELSKERPELVQEIVQSNESAKVLSEMATSLNVETDKLVETVQEQTQELAKVKAIVAESKKSHVESIVEKILQEHISDSAIRNVVSRVVRDDIREVVSEMSQSEDSVDESKVKDAIMEQMKTPEIVALLKTKTDSSVPASEDASNTDSRKLTRIVEKQN